MKKRQISITGISHTPDEIKNFSPDGKLLCYDSLRTIYIENPVNCISI